MSTNSKRRSRRTSRPSVPTIVAGDVNDRPGLAGLAGAHRRARATRSRSPAWRSAAHRRRPRNPQKMIDGIFVDPRITVRAARVLDRPDVLLASDHRPVLAELELSPSGQPRRAP